MEIVNRRRIRRIVRDLYRAVLGREPDPDGAQTYETLMGKLGAERAIPEILRAFLRSAEFRDRAGALASSYVNDTLASQGSWLVNGRPVQHIVSLGSFCLPSLILRRNGLRRYSLPFDWIFSNPPMLRDCLADDFALFLDRRYYRSIRRGKKEHAAEHELFREKYGIPGLFAHRDPTQEADYLYLVRCVTRFRQLLRGEDAKLFLLMGRAHHNLTSEFPRVVETLNGVTRNFVVLAIELLDPTERGLTALVPLNKIGEHALHQFTPSSFNTVGTFLPDKLDEWTLLRLIYRYRLELKDSPWTGSETLEQADEDSEEHSERREAAHALS